MSLTSSNISYQDLKQVKDQLNDNLVGSTRKRSFKQANYKDDSSSDDETIIVNKSKKTSHRSSIKAATTPSPESDSDDDEPIRNPKKKKKTASKPATPKNAKVKNGASRTNKLSKKRNSSIKDVPLKQVKIESEPSSEIDIDQLINEDGVKWETLHHQGVYFAPEYEPHGIPLIYNNQHVQLKKDSEEIATFFAGVVNTDYQNNPVFCANFFDDFKEVLQQDGHVEITDFNKCDFTLMYNHLEELKAQRKQMTKEDKLVLKNEKLDIEKQFGTALVNGKPEKIGNFRIEPPGLFRGRGKHPKTGKLKKRLFPSDVVINISKDAPVPTNKYNMPWKQVIHNPNVTWLAMWKENINNNFKYVFLSHGSLWKSASDVKKFEKARELHQFIAPIRKQYNRDLQSNDPLTKQRATALYFIDMLALRAGNEKGDDEADTVGCCNLRVEHVQLEEPDSLIFDFLGKDSIRYYNKVTVPLVVFQNIKTFMSKKQENEDLFELLTTSSLNKHLSTLMTGLTAKVFRTYNASYTFQQELKQTPWKSDATMNDKILAYNRSNRQVAIVQPVPHLSAIAFAADAVVLFFDSINSFKTCYELLALFFGFSNAFTVD